MKILNNILVGFLVSFIGSIPLGYLNVFGFEIYKKLGLNETYLYLLGVITIEFFVILFTLVFAKQLMNNKKIIKYIEGFSILFMFILAYIFYSSASSEASNQLVLKKYFYYSPYSVGIILSSLNFIQIPFWLSWNLYLLNDKFIDVSKSNKYFYVLGTLIGTFLGMLVLILSLNYLTIEVEFFKLFLFKFIIPIVFMVLGIFQGFKFYKKWY